ncbi:MAG TPA: hypothetical protein VGL09_08295 [Methylomirabilota bacterium]|jgi:hypothetical protein
MIRILRPPFRRSLCCALVAWMAAAATAEAPATASKDPATLVAAARRLAASARPEDQAELRRRLESAEFLTRLDEPARYQGAPQGLRLSEVLGELSRNRAPTAEATLVALTRSRVFRAEPLRAELLIRACVPLRPPSPDVVRFWDEHWQRDDGYSHVTAGAVCDNGTAPALALLERKMADPTHPDDDKRVWIVTGIMMHRNDVPMLESCERMLRSGLPARLRPLLVEAIFDYRPTEWFRPATVLVPPDRALASPAARERLRRLGEYALKSVPLTEAQKNAVTGVLNGLK